MSTIIVKDGNKVDKYYETSGAGTASNPFKSINIIDSFADGPNLDAFSRLRISNPETLFDSKQLYDNAPLIWDDSEVSGTSTTSVHNVNTASTVISVGGATAGKRVRQTFMRFNYQPGKSQLVLMTGTLDLVGGGAGINRSFGLFDDNNGIFLKDDEGVYKMVIRSSTSGSPVDNEVAQSSWNLDTMDGTGSSGITLDFTKSLILFIDFEWLGVGRVRTGFIIGGKPIYVHEFLHSNLQEGVYMSTPNLPLRYEIENTGAGVASGLRHICASVISEGGSQDLGIIRTVSNGSTFVNANVVGTLYALVGIRLKSTHIGSVVKQLTESVLAATPDNLEWHLIKNPTVAGTFTYTGLANSAIEFATGDTTNTVSGGTILSGGYLSGDQSIYSDLNSADYLGSAIDGTPDTLVLCVRPLGVNLDVFGSLTFRELQ